MSIISDYTAYIRFQKISGVFADVNFNNEPEDVSFNVPSLKELSASKLVSHISLLRGVYDIPPRLRKLLMYTAIELGRPLAIILLLRIWPDENLTIALPYVCRTWKIFVRDELKVLSQFYDSATVVLRNFIQPKTHLKKLDLSALPLEDSQISIICSLAISEIPTESHPDFEVFLNCQVEEHLTLKQLISAFEAQAGGRSRMKLVMRGLHVHSDLYSDELAILCRFLNPHELEQFSCQYCLTYPIVNDVLKIMEGFHSLKVLCLQQINHLHALKSVLDQMVYLERLDIRGNLFANDLEFFLSDMYHQSYLCCSSGSSPSLCGKLEFLDLSNCRIYERSILYLAISPHAQTLFTLNLNSLMSRLNLSSLLVLLKACKNLRVLQLEDNRFDVENLNPLFEFLPSMNKLKYLNIALDLSTEYMFSVVPLICEMPNLVNLRIKFPMEEHFLDPVYTVEVFTRQYRKLIKNTAPFKKISLHVTQ